MNGKIMLNGKAYSSSGRPSREITMAQWLALPDTKYTDGIVYYIKDIGGANQFPPLIYSDEEREVGVWRDGKPLYEKIFVTPSLSGPYDMQTGIPFGMAMIVGGYYILNDNNSMIGLNEYFASANYSYCHAELDGDIKCMLQGYTGVGYIILQYTKTTDTPGSGTWTTDGTYTHHYSTSEKVVGTYIDGKTVYEKLYDTSISSGFYVLDNDISVDMLVSATGSILDGDGLAYNFPYYYGNNQMARLIRDSSSLWTTNRGLVLHSDGFTYAKLIVRYTKYTSS